MPRRSSRPSAGRSPDVNAGDAKAGSRLRRGTILAGVLVALLLVAGVGMIWFVQNQGDAEAALPGVSIGGPFALIDGAGRPVTDGDFRGKYMLVYFGYTFCPDVCPTTLNDVAQALDKLGPRADRVQALFITVDPKRDTPAVVRQYAAAFSPRLMGLTGTPTQIAAVAREYRVYYAEHRTGPGANDYSMDHSSILYLMGPAGKFIEPIRADEGADAMAADLAKQLPAG
jgi:protein SCO1/2